MILLPEQFQMCILHLVMGWLFGLLFSFENALNIHCFKVKLQKLVEFVFFTGFMLLFYYALYTLNGGMTHLYCVLLFVLGVFIYFKFYLMTFSPFINSTVKASMEVQKKLTLAICRCLAIIDVRPKLKKWRNRLGKRKQKNRHNKKNTKKADYPHS